MSENTLPKLVLEVSGQVVSTNLDAFSVEPDGEIPTIEWNIVDAFMTYRKIDPSFRPLLEDFAWYYQHCSF